MHDFVDYNVPMMPYGTDEETGYPLWLLSRQRFAVVLPKCKCCGTENVISAPLGRSPKDLCYECNNRLNNFKMSKSRLSIWSSVKCYSNFVGKLQWYLDRQDEGLWVPEWLPDAQRIAAEVEPYIAEKIEREAAIEAKKYDHEDFCNYCNCKREVKRYGSRCICKDCANRKERYAYLRLHLQALNSAELQEFSDLLDTYKDIQKRGGWAPNIPVMRRRLQCRLDASSVK